MTTRETLTDDPDQVERLIRWWISQDGVRYHRIRRRGTIPDFINDVWVRLLLAFPPGHSVAFTVSTVVVSSCYWELHKYITVGTRRPHQMLTARRVKPSDLIEDGTHAETVAIQNEFTLSIAHLMRTLTFRQAAIIRARYGLFGDPDLSLEDIGRVLRITREGVRHVEGKALEKLQHHTRARKLRPFVDELTKND